jgi:hypothetical protein
MCDSRTEAGVPKVKVNSFKKTTGITPNRTASTHPPAGISQIKSNTQFAFLGLGCAHHSRQKNGGQQNHLFQKFSP